MAKFLEETRSQVVTQDPFYAKKDNCLSLMASVLIFPVWGAPNCIIIQGLT